MNNTQTNVLTDLRLLAVSCLCAGFTCVSAANLPCADWEATLVDKVSKANTCEVKLKACNDKEFGNPMRELNYCQHVNKNCQALDTRPGNATLAHEITEFKKSCVKD
jgi:hypothetical protein